MMEKEKKLRNMVYTGLFAALICLTTAFILHIPVGNGYIHLGDSFIYLAACMLPMPYGILAAAIGGSMADLLSGYAIYAIPTAIIKSMLAGCFYSMGVSSTKTVCCHHRSGLLSHRRDPVRESGGADRRDGAGKSGAGRLLRRFVLHRRLCP